MWISILLWQGTINDIKNWITISFGKIRFLVEKNELSNAK